MINRGDAERNQYNEQTAGGHEPERLESAEFTMSNAPDASPAGTQAEDHPHGTGERVFDQEQIDSRRAEWDEIQARFIDDPEQAVKEADQLVAGTIDDITRTFAEERSRLEHEWTSADDSSTEDMRVTFQRYRALLNRLLSM